MLHRFRGRIGRKRAIGLAAVGVSVIAVAGVFVSMALAITQHGITVTKGCKAVTAVGSPY